MKKITDWLDDRLNGGGAETAQDLEVEQRAEIIRAEAEAAGYSQADLDEACGGDIAEFLKYRQREAGAEDAEGKMAGDPVPAPLPGFNQQ